MNEEVRKRIQEKLDKLNNVNNEGPSNIWKMKSLEPGASEGETSVIRVIKYPFTGEEDPFQELYFHYNVGAGPGILCPKFNAGKECPVCDFASELNSGTEKDKELAKTLRASARYYAVVIDREDEELKPRYWGFGVTVYRELLGKYVDPEYCDFMELENGLDLKVKFVKDAKQKWPNTSITFFRKESPLADKKTIKEILNNVKPIEEVFKPITKAEIKKRLNDWLNFSEDEAEKHSGETVKSGVKEVSLELDGDDAIAAAFEEALED